MTRPQTPLFAAAGLVSLGALVAWLPGCAGPTVTRADEANAVSRAVPPPLHLAGTAYEAAADVVLPDVPAGNYPGLHNVFRLSETIISGSEPVDDEALAQLAAWGVKTVLSVDGGAPDAETAEALGMRYVHVPLRYEGVNEEQLAQIAKTFRELEAPFYVHCFHGKHRGPTAAAIGRVALDGLHRDRAIAEMRQWCATAGKYEGLYASVATADIPSAERTAAYDFDFSSAHRPDGLREVMIGMTRTIDEVKIVRASGWLPNAHHPDVDPLRSAQHLRELYAAHAWERAVDEYPSDFGEMLAEGRRGIDDLVRFLTEAGGDADALAANADAIEDAYLQTYESCLDCHGPYRNRKR